MFSWESAKHFFVAHSSAPESTWLDVRLKKWRSAITGWLTMK
jgi:hypothetical protein